MTSTTMLQPDRRQLPTREAAPGESQAWLEQPYLAYAYSYPHKSAYGPLTPPVPLGPLWQAEQRQALFLYLHIPFCEMRCGFCNLFTRAVPEEDLVATYLQVLARQARVLAEATAGDRNIARLALGGGTPTYLGPDQLDGLFRMVDQLFHAHPSRIPTSVETSPKTASLNRLRVLRDHGVSRVSLGVQSFIDAEAHAMGRPQATAEVCTALDRIRRLDFPILNMDLIYGHPMQTVASWLTSVRTAVAYGPREIFLYPLYVRPQTGLARHGQSSSARGALHRACYREGRDLLLAEGFEQVSMRCFRRLDDESTVEPAYCCQTDDMLGLGCGARSYTSRLHYSSRFAVEHAGVQAILQDWLRQSDQELGHATWGIWVSDDERQRRFVIQSLLNREGLDQESFRARFGDPVLSVYPQLAHLIDLGLATAGTGRLSLTAEGLELSDAIGPWLYSPACRQALERFTKP